MFDSSSLCPPPWRGHVKKKKKKKKPTKISFLALKNSLFIGLAYAIVFLHFDQNTPNNYSKCLLHHSKMIYANLRSEAVQLRFSNLMSASLSLSFPPIPPPLAPREWLRRPTLSRLPSTHYASLQTDRRRRSPITMSSDHHLPTSELSDESNFETIVSPDGLISICGFGSLLSGTYDQSHHSSSLFVCFLKSDRTVNLSLRTREEREEYISRPDRLQSCEIERLSARFRPRGSDFLRAWYSQARNQGSFYIINLKPLIVIDIFVLLVQSVWFPGKVRKITNFEAKQLFALFFVSYRKRENE